MYDGSVYTSGVGYSQGSRSSGSSTFGAFDGEDSFVYFTHPVSSLVAFPFVHTMTEDALMRRPFAIARLFRSFCQVLERARDGYRPNIKSRRFRLFTR